MNQEMLVMEYLKEHGSITAAEAMSELGIARLASRICTLRQRGIEILGKDEYGTNRFGKKVKYSRYYLP